MIPRSFPAEMAALFTDEARFDMWLEVELLAVEGWAAVGDVPPPRRPAGRRRPPGSTPPLSPRWPSANGHRPRRGRLRRRGPGAPSAQPDGSWIHYGLTSSDVVDTALCATLTRASDLLLGAASAAGRRAASAGPSSSSRSR